MMIDQLDNIIPEILDICAVLFQSGAFDQYVETILRFWTFFLRWNRRKHKKTSISFPIRLFLLEKYQSPFYQIIGKFIS